jgi:hypothetical protein
MVAEKAPESKITLSGLAYEKQQQRELQPDEKFMPRGMANENKNVREEQPHEMEIFNKGLNAEIQQLVSEACKLKAKEDLKYYQKQMEKAMKTEFKAVLEETRKLCDERKKEVRREHEKFMQAKRQGTKAVLNYKLTKLQFKGKFNEKMKGLFKGFGKIWKFSYGAGANKPAESLIASASNVYYYERQIKMLDYAKAQMEKARELLKKVPPTRNVEDNKAIKAQAEEYVRRISEEVSDEIDEELVTREFSGSPGSNINWITGVINKITDRKNELRRLKTVNKRDVYSSKV